MPYLWESFWLWIQNFWLVWAIQIFGFFLNHHSEFVSSKKFVQVITDLEFISLKLFIILTNYYLMSIETVGRYPLSILILVKEKSWFFFLFEVSFNLFTISFYLCLGSWVFSNMHPCWYSNSVNINNFRSAITFSWEVQTWPWLQTIRSRVRAGCHVLFYRRDSSCLS